MGLLRLLLALSVVIAHTTNIFGYSLLGARMSVQAFFIISGFYMALVINEKYSLIKNSYKLFITNRFLRIYPIYLVVLVITLVFNLTGIDSQPIRQTQPFLLNLIKNLWLFPSLDPWLYIPDIYGGLIVFQAWTLSLEMQFYLVAPLLVKLQGKALMLLVLASVASRIYFTHPIRFYPDMMIDSFIPTEAIFFLMGIWSYKLYSKIKNLNIDTRVLKLSYFGFIGFTFLFQYLSLKVDVINYFFPRTLEWSYYIALMVSIPLMFSFTSGSKWDKLLGDLSFPVYISHALIITGLVFGGLSKNNDGHKVLIIICVLVFSYLLNRYIATPIEKFRQKRILSTKVNY